MSNYAPNPEAQDIYKGLAQQKLSDVTGSQIQNLTDPVFIQAENQDRLITMNIINQAAMRDGNVMPNTGGIISLSQSTGNVAVEIRPPEGEVYKIMGLSLRNSATPTGTNYYNTFLSTPATALANDTPSQSNGDVSYSSIGSSSTELLTESLFEEVFQPLIITSELFIRCYSNMAETAGGATVEWKAAFMRIR